MLNFLAGVFIGVFLGIIIVAVLQMTGDNNNDH
jgi:hypothetical protein